MRWRSVDKSCEAISNRSSRSDVESLAARGRGLPVCHSRSILKECGGDVPALRKPHESTAQSIERHFTESKQFVVFNCCPELKVDSTFVSADLLNGSGPQLSRSVRTSTGPQTDFFERAAFPMSQQDCRSVIPLASHQFARSSASCLSRFTSFVTGEESHPGDPTSCDARNLQSRGTSRLRSRFCVPRKRFRTSAILLRSICRSQPRTSASVVAWQRAKSRWASNRLS